MAEGGRNTRLPSGYAEDFVNAVEEDLQCSVCHLPLKEPVLTRCGHRFCKECLEEQFKRQGDNGQYRNCPTDRVDLNPAQDVFPDKATERKILSFAIKCPTEGCVWTGELRNKKDHLASCPCVLVPCTNKNCDVKVRRRNFQQHVRLRCQWRIIPCEHCSEPHPKCQMRDHEGKCAKCPVPCTNNCGRSIPREKIPDHTSNDCPLSLISCPYEQIGCKRKIQRQDVESHLESAMKPHLDLACVKLETRTFIWKVQRFSEVLRRARTGEMLSIGSSPFYTDRTESYGYKLKVKMFPNGQGRGVNTHLSVLIVVLKGDYDAILPWPFKKKVKFTLIDQQKNLDAERENFTRQFITDNHPVFERPNRKRAVVGADMLISYLTRHFIKTITLWMTLCFFRLRSALHAVEVLFLSI